MTVQMRIRLPQSQAEKLLSLPPRMRLSAVTLMIGSLVERVDLARLVELEPTLRNLGTLLNQSLRISKGIGVDNGALLEATNLLLGLRGRR